MRYDFRQPLEDLVIKGEYSRKKLCDIGGISEETLSRWLNNAPKPVKPDHDTLIAWNKNAALPHCFRVACESIIGPTRYTDPRRAAVASLDYDGDGRVTAKDLTRVNSQKQLASARRSVHLDISLADGVMSQQEATEDAHLAREERALSEQGELISRHLATA